MKQFVIHDGKGNYLPTTKHGVWTKRMKYAKKYSNKPAMFKKLLSVMENNPTQKFYFEILEVEFVSKGSQTLGAYNRIKKVKSITTRIDNNKE